MFLLEKSLMIEARNCGRRCWKAQKQYKTVYKKFEVSLFGTRSYIT